MARDMTKAQFDAAMSRHGFRWQGFMGYVRVSWLPHVSVCAMNAGDCRRAQLAYLIQARDRVEREHQDTFQPMTCDDARSVYAGE